MLVAISQKTVVNQHGDTIDSLETNYTQYLESLGFTILLIPNHTQNIPYYFDRFPIEGIILSGGNDINPKSYGQTPDINLSLALQRDTIEKKLLELAVEKKLPVLGICRGMQFINVYFGGRITNLNQHPPRENHLLNISQYQEIFTPQTLVNSYHNQGITPNELSPQLHSFAQTDTGIIEGLYHPSLPLAAIQWHPERESPQPEFNHKLLQAFKNQELFWKKATNTKAIILAAGMGTRLGKYTENVPKCMLNFNGKTLIQQQVETLRSVGITDITIVRGFQAEKIQIPGVKYYTSHNYQNTNMVETLFCAEQEMTDDLLICYADILYEKRILQEIINSPAQIGVTVDQDYWDYWQARTDQPEEDMESLIIQDNKIIDLGNTNCTRDQASVRYVGLIKFSKSALEHLKRVYHHHKSLYFDKDEPWLRSKSFKKAYMTCLLQALINDGQTLQPITIRRGWLEFDTEEDYEKYSQWLQQGTLYRFFNFD